MESTELKYDPSQPRNKNGEWSGGGDSSGHALSAASEPPTLTGLGSATAERVLQHELPKTLNPLHGEYHVKDADIRQMGHKEATAKLKEIRQKIKDNRAEIHKEGWATPANKLQDLTNHSVGLASAKEALEVHIWGMKNGTRPEKKSMDNTLIAFGSEIKTLSDDGETMRIGGHLVLFGSPDEHDLSPLEANRGRDYFDKDTDFGLKEGKGVAPVLYHHGLNPALKNRQLSMADLSLTDDGVWMECELKSRDAYEKRVMELQRLGKLGLSSGIHSDPGQVRREAKSTSKGEKCHHITYWPLGEDASLTPTPADWRTKVVEIKSLADVEGWPDELEEVQPESKSETNETLAPELKSFVDHRDEALDAIDGFISRASEIKALRTSRKTGAPISATMRESLTSAKSSLVDLQGEIDGILATDEPEVKAEIDPEDAPASKEEVAAAWQAFLANNVKNAGIEVPKSQE